MKSLGFAIATLFFVAALTIVIKKWNDPHMTIASFAALEFCGIYIYTIYDYLKTLK